MGIIHSLNSCYKEYNINKELKLEITNNSYNIPEEEGLFCSDEKTKIFTTNKEYKEINILSFLKRKEEAKKLIEKGTKENIKRAIEYDNTSYEVILKNNKFSNNDEVLKLFKGNESKEKFRKLVKEIIDSANWNDTRFLIKYNEYKRELNNRINFNQPIDANNEPLFFYKSKMHILINLLEYDDFSKFKKKLKIKREVYNKIEILNIIENDKYPKELPKLKLFMIILIRVDDQGAAYFMINSIYDEKRETKYYFSKIKEIVNQNVSYTNDSITIEGVAFIKKRYSFESLLYCLTNEPKNIKLLYNDRLYKYDYFLENYCIIDYFNEFKELIKIFIKSKYFTNIILELFKKKKKEINYIQSDEFIELFLSKINIIPISKEKVPFLDKFSLDIFLGGYDSENIRYYGRELYKESISRILKIGCHFVYIIHEGGGHFIYSYFTIISISFFNFVSR